GAVPRARPGPGMNGPLAARAPGKVNLCLRVGAPRADGLHELVSAVQAVSLADDLTLEPASGPGDEVVCPEVEGENLAARALAARASTSGTCRRSSGSG